MEQSPSRKARSCITCETPRLLCNFEVHCRIRKMSSLDYIMSQMSPVHTLTDYFFKIRFNIILSCMPRSLMGPASSLEVIRIPVVCNIIISPCVLHVIAHDIITLTVLGEQ
jgi:hypothetical protein